MKCNIKTGQPPPTAHDTYWGGGGFGILNVLIVNEL